MPLDLRNYFIGRQMIFNIQCFYSHFYTDEVDFEMVNDIKHEMKADWLIFS